MLVVHKASHVDHVADAVIQAVLEAHKETENPDGKVLVVEVPLPEDMRLACRLRGPAVGDPPVPEDEVVYVIREGRDWPSRMVLRPPVFTAVLTVVMGPYGGDPLVLYTCYPGPAAPKEPGDPGLLLEEKDAAIKFWAEHALCG